MFFHLFDPYLPEGGQADWVNGIPLTNNQNQNNSILNRIRKNTLFFKTIDLFGFVSLALVAV